jgi:hypothetical protein
MPALLQQVIALEPMDNEEVVIQDYNPAIIHPMESKYGGVIPNSPAIACPTGANIDGRLAYDGSGALINMAETRVTLSNGIHPLTIGGNVAISIGGTPADHFGLFPAGTGSTLAISGNYYTNGTVVWTNDGQHIDARSNEIQPVCVVNRDMILKSFGDNYELYFEFDGKEYTAASELKIKTRPTKKFLAQERFKGNLADTRKQRYLNKIIKSADRAELKAQETLREFISEAEWRRYITCGYIMVRNPISKRWFQIFRDQRIAVYEHGKLACRLCIHSKNCPPTDHVISMKTLVEFDEGSLWKQSNIHDVNSQTINQLRARMNMEAVNGILTNGLQNNIVVCGNLAIA